MALISLSDARQLLVDDYLVESMKNARRVMNPAAKASANPVVRPDRPWEGNYIAPCHAIYDKRERVFKMWYTGARYYAYRKPNGQLAYGPADNDDARPSTICLATSADGLNWEKPDLDLVEFGGSRKNNILPGSSFMPFMFLDSRETDPAKRFKGLVRKGSYDGRGMQFDLHYSPDGFQWTPYPGNPIIDTTPRPGRWGPTLFHGWDPIRRTYHAHMENCVHFHCPLNRRLVGRAESPDMIHWGEPETIVVPDADDPPDLEFYYMACLPYEGLYIGLLCAFRTNTATHHVQIAFSRDGVHYDRRYRDAFVPIGPQGAFDASSIYPLDPIVHEGRVLIFYQGVNWRSVETLYELGDRALGAAGLAEAPLDGFVSADGGRTEYGELTTRSFGFPGRKLAVTLQAHLIDWQERNCDVRVELLTANHMPIPGFGREDADPVTETVQRRVVSWRGKSDLAELAGKPIRARFHIRNAKLYSFQFLP